MKSPFQKKKHFFSLIEIAIGFTLAAFLLTSLFNNFRYIMLVNRKLQNARDLIHERSLLIFRLNQVLNSLGNESHFHTEVSPEKILGEIASKQISLKFIYENGIDFDPNFCDKTQGMLTYRENQLCLLSIGKNNKKRKEILWKKASECSFSFFDSQQRVWVFEWNKKILPQLVKISLGNKEEFLFYLLNASHIIEY